MTQLSRCLHKLSKLDSIVKFRKHVSKTLDSCSAKSSSFCCRGVLISSVATMASLILPMAVEEPVPMTTPLALPEETLVPEKTMFFLSWLTAQSGWTGHS